jgi:hypothetical protein
MAMKYCHVCQLSISDTATFCATCGAQVPDAAAPREPLAAPASATVSAAPATSAAPPSDPVKPVAVPPVAVLISPQGVLAAAPPVAAGAGPATAFPAAPAMAFPAAPAMAFPATAAAAPTPPAPATHSEAALSPAAEPAPLACLVCRRTVTAVEDGGVCHSCRDDLDLFVAAGLEESAGVSLAGGTSNGRQRVTASNAIYSALADDDTCPVCRAMDGRETGDIAAAAGWAPNRRCRSPLGCRCAVFYEHESLAAGEEPAFIAYAAAHGLHVTAPAVSAFHDETRRIRQAADRLDDATLALAEARTLEKIDPEQAVTRYREAIDCLMACGESPLDERRVRRDLPFAFNRLTLVLKALDRRPEALDEIERAAAMGILDRDDCGRKADRDALLNRRQRLRESLTAGATA